MNDDYEFLVDTIQQLIEARGDSYQKALHIVNSILVPAMQKIKDEYEMLMLTDKSNPM